MFFPCDWKVCPCLNSGIIGNDHALNTVQDWRIKLDLLDQYADVVLVHVPIDSPDSRHNTSRWDITVRQFYNTFSI